MLTSINLGHNGRLGNQLFQIASTIGIAKKFGYTFGFLPWKYQEYFANPLPEYTRLKKHHALRPRHLCPPCKMPVDYTEYRPGAINSLEGLMQSEKYFVHCADKIRYYFELKHQPEAMEIEPGATCIHYRAKEFHLVGIPVQTEKYYKAALKEIKPAGPVYVFSDDIDEAKQVIKGENFIYISGASTSLSDHAPEAERSRSRIDMLDFYMMAQCTNFIIANSAFSWWAAWLSAAKNKKVVAPANWYPENMQVSKTDIYAEGWVVK